jgi:hypothetical protein
MIETYNNKKKREKLANGRGFTIIFIFSSCYYSFEEFWNDQLWACLFQIFHQRSYHFRSYYHFHFIYKKKREKLAKGQGVTIISVSLYLDQKKIESL